MKKYNLLIEKYQKYNIFSYSKESMNILKKFINKDYYIEKEYKNDKRTYVAKIILDGKAYVIKKPCNNKLKKKFLIFFKKCESLVLFFNTDKVKREGLNEIVTVLGAGVYKKYGIIKEEFYISEYIDGKVVIDNNSILKMINISKKIHKLNRFHGDCNPFNFLIFQNNIYVIDTKLKKMYFGNYRAHYDILTLLKYFKGNIKYPYKKNIFYYIALLVRKIRNKRGENN